MRRLKNRVAPFSVIVCLLLAGAAPLTVACSDATGACCKTCTTGKACGDSCIATNLTCNVGPGCACNG